MIRPVSGPPGGRAGRDHVDVEADAAPARATARWSGTGRPCRARRAGRADRGGEQQRRGVLKVARRAPRGVRDRPGAQVRVRMDSKLVVEQMSGRWKVKHEDMRRLAGEVGEVRRAIESAGGPSLSGPAGANKAADRLSNEAMDGHSVRRTPAARAHGPRCRGNQSPPTRRTLPTTWRTSGTCGLLVQAPSGARRRASRGGRPAARRPGQPCHHLHASRWPSRPVGPSPRSSAPRSRSPRTGRRTPEGLERARGRGELSGIRRIAVERGDGGRCDHATWHRHRLAEVLGLGPERFWSLATAPGSLSGVEAWADGTASVAFTNRTDHLAYGHCAIFAA